MCKFRYVISQRPYRLTGSASSPLDLILLLRGRPGCFFVNGGNGKILAHRHQGTAHDILGTNTTCGRHRSVKTGQRSHIHSLIFDGVPPLYGDI